MMIIPPALYHLDSVAEKRFICEPSDIVVVLDVWQSLEPLSVRFAEVKRDLQSSCPSQ